MALIACPECTREISDKAATCPHCGNPMRPIASPAPPPITTPIPAPKGEGCFLQTLNLGCAIVLIFIVIAVIGSCIATNRTDPMKRSYSPSSLNEPQIV